MRSFTFNTAASSPRKSALISLLNPTAAPCPEFTLSEVTPANIYLVAPSISGFAYDPLSGIAALTVNVGLGTPGAIPALGSFTTWTPIVVNSINIGWSGVLYFNSTALINAFTISGGGFSASIQSTLEFSYTDESGDIVCFGSFPVTIYNRILLSGSTGVTPQTVTKIFAIPSGTDTATITGLALTAVPRAILLNVEKPAGGLNLFATVSSPTISTDGFEADLSGLTDATGYNLIYTLVF